MIEKCTAKPKLNATMLKFGAPQATICQYQYWSVLLRPAQATLGSLILVAHEPVQEFSKLSQASFTELHQVTTQMESALRESFQYDKLNYLMLMMVDVDVHFHVIPRYAHPQKLYELAFIDKGWPKAPDLGHVNKTGAAINQRIMDHITSNWL